MKFNVTLESQTSFIESNLYMMAGTQNVPVLAYSDPVVKFLQGSDHSFSNDNVYVKILATIAFTLYILYFRDVGVEKLADDDLNKLFVRLSRAFAARGDQAVSIPELKMAVAKTHL